MSPESSLPILRSLASLEVPCLLGPGAQELSSVGQKCELTYLSIAGIIAISPTDNIVLCPLWAEPWNQQFTKKD